MLFRRQAIEAKRTELYGEVLIVTPMAFKVLVGFFATIIIGLLVFITVASFARIERVPGAIVPSRGVIDVSASSPGVLTRLHVDEGQQVRQGEVVGRVVGNPLATGEGTERGARIAAIGQKIANVDARLEHERALNELKTESVRRKIDDIRKEIARKTDLRDVQVRILEDTRAAYERAERASRMKVIRANDLTSRSVRMLSAEKELSQLDAEIASLRDERARQQLQLQEMRAQIRLSRTELEAEREDLVNERSVLEGDKAYDIIAPAAGRVTAVLMSEGFDTDGSRPIFSILPSGSRLQAELYVPSKAIGFVETGQEVRLLFDAFPFERFGAQPGTVESVTDSVILPNDSQFLVSRANAVNEPVYKVTVSLGSTTIDANGRELPVRQGMLLNANIILEERSILSWILEPIYAVLGRS